MARYSVTNNFRFLEFDDLDSDLVISINKESVQEIRVTQDDPWLFILHSDNIGDHRFKYDEVLDPLTGLPFTSISEFKNFTVESLNDLGAVSSIPIGAWDATANIPTLGDGATHDTTGDTVPNEVATANSYYIVGTAGTTSIDGISVWDVGDYVRSNGTSWIKITSADIISAAKVSYNATTVQLALNDLFANNTLAALDDVEITGVLDGQSIVYDSLSGTWVPGSSSGGGIETIVVNALIDPTSTEPLTDGDYALIYVGTPGVPSWAPVGTQANDVLHVESGVWTISAASASFNAGELLVSVLNSGVYVQYLWMGSVWNSLNGYEPSAVLESILIANPIGELSGLTGSELRGKPISWLFDQMLFTTIYIAPNPPTLSISGSTGNYERGFDITGTRAITFTQNGAGSVNSYTIVAVEDNITKDSLTGATLPSAIDLDNINGYNLMIPTTAGNTAKATLAVSYDEGPVPVDNKGVEHPADTILAGTLNSEAVFTSRYPIWIGTTAERFTIPTGAESTTKPFLDPNSGSNVAGTVLNSSWIKNNLTKELFITNLSNKVATIQAGDVHCFVACPPGITLSKAEIFAAGNWLDWDDFEVHSIQVPLTNALEADPRNYTVHFVRSAAANNFSSIQNFRISTTGVITP